MVFSSFTFIFAFFLPLIVIMAGFRYCLSQALSTRTVLTTQATPKATATVTASHLETTPSATSETVFTTGTTTYTRSWLSPQQITRSALWLMILASLTFYSWQRPDYLLLLLVSIIINRLLGFQISHKHKQGDTRTKTWLIVAVSFNLLMIAYFKYQNFFIENINALGHTDLPLTDIALPLGISFFTFQQIAWQIDLYQRKVDYGSHTDYLFFVSFFPQLIAGPIVHYRQLVPQIQNPLWLSNRYLIQGFFLFVLGLSKKVLIADTLARYVDPLYASAEQLASNNQLMTAPDAWAAAFGYGLQLYFDFSGYADMALGLALMLGIRLPFNFMSPYQSVSIVQFWRRWHITLSHFLRDYIYIPLGGSKKGIARQYYALLLTMLLGGLWHGAGWAFVLWGGLHGISLIVNHAWQRLSPWKLPALIGWLITFILVMVYWVPFRAESFEVSLHIWHSMLVGSSAGLDSHSLTQHLLHWLHDWRILFAANLPLFTGEGINAIYQLWLERLINQHPASIWLYIAGAGFIACILPSSFYWMRVWPQYSQSKLKMTLTGVYCFILLAACLKSMLLSPEQVFLYFNF
ncbi:MAG: membrane-bound O-acyltransferase family protein [Oceanospirillum sp.]|nr:membrane-bound O-acyltransferase family protein [Oceanospirillum sp.]